MIENYSQEGVDLSVDAFPSSVSSVDLIWSPWGSDDPFVMESFAAGLDDLLSRCADLPISRYSKFFKKFSVCIGIIDHDKYFDYQRGEISYLELNRVTSWNEGPVDLSGGPICLIRFELEAKDDIASTKCNASELRKFSFDYANIINNFNCAMSIARPGCFQFSSHLDSMYTQHGPRSYNGFWRYVPLVNKEVGWPILRQFQVHKIWEWFISQPGIASGKGKSELTRALSIYTRLFRQHFITDELQDIVWSVAGIEALLGESGYTAFGALKPKLKVIFPGMDGAKINIDKELRQLYKVRSSLVHGSESLLGRFYLQDVDEQNDRIESFAAFVLLCLLQVAFQRKISRFEFEHVFR